MGRYQGRFEKFSAVACDGAEEKKEKINSVLGVGCHGPCVRLWIIRLRFFCACPGCEAEKTTHTKSTATAVLDSHFLRFRLHCHITIGSSRVTATQPSVREPFFSFVIPTEQARDNPG